jgi:hypothetical protein
MSISRRAQQTFVLGVAAVVLSGCSGTIFTPADLESGESFFIDARQRMITNTRIDDGKYQSGQITPKRIICAEPNPDVALAVAHSLGAGINVMGYGSGNLSNAVSQGLAQLGERFAAVQLLRDILYRSCEAYANGAISNTTYALMMARLDETTTTLLLGEMAAGAFGRQLGAIQGTADAKAAANLTESLNAALKPASSTTPATGSSPSGQGGASPTKQVDSKTDSDVKAATTVLGTVGTITGRSAPGEVAGEVAKIHKAFLDDDNLDALLVACITSLSHEPVKNASDTETALSSICKKQIFGDFMNNAAKIIRVKADAEVLVTRARTESAYVDALRKCFDVFADKAKDSCAPLISAVAAIGSSAKPAAVDASTKTAGVQ